MLPFVLTILAPPPSCKFPPPRRFDVVKIVKPEASRSESSELYVYASQFKPASKGTREERGGKGGGKGGGVTPGVTPGGTPGGTGEGTTLD